MKIAVWSVGALFALLWTLAAWAVVAVLHWSVGFVSSGEAVDVGRAVASLPIPAWITYWIDVRAVHAMLEGAVWALEGLQQSSPWIAGALGWLVPATWIVWGLGIVLLLMLTGAGHFLVGRFNRPRALPAT